MLRNLVKIIQIYILFAPTNIYLSYGTNGWRWQNFFVSYEQVKPCNKLKTNFTSRLLSMLETILFVINYLVKNFKTWLFESKRVPTHNALRSNRHLSDAIVNKLEGKHHFQMKRRRRRRKKLERSIEKQRCRKVCGLLGRERKYEAIKLFYIFFLSLPLSFSLLSKKPSSNKVWKSFLSSLPNFSFLSFVAMTRLPSYQRP